MTMTMTIFGRAHFPSHSERLRDFSFSKILVRISFIFSRSDLRNNFVFLFLVSNYQIYREIFLLASQKLKWPRTDFPPEIPFLVPTFGQSAFCCCLCQGLFTSSCSTTRKLGARPLFEFSFGPTSQCRNSLSYRYNIINSR